MPEVEQLQSQIKKYKALALEDEDLISILNKKIQLNQLLNNSNSNSQLELEYLRKSLVTLGKNKYFWEQATKKELIILFKEFFSSIICKEGNIAFNFKI